MLTAMRFDRNGFSKGSQALKNDVSLQIASYVPFTAYALLHPEASQSILLGVSYYSHCVFSSNNVWIKLNTKYSYGS